jgi:hypothetical protein
MKGNVDPFEPWRPAEASVPPPVRATQPWRPSPPPPRKAAVEEPPFVEPVEPLRNKRPPRSTEPQNRKGQPCQGRTPVSQLFAMGVFFLLVVLGIVSADWFRVTHLPRLVVLGVSAGMLAGMALNRRRSWQTRLTWMAIALTLAGISAWFVPTLRGVNLWSAYRQVDELRTLPAGAVADFLRTAPERKKLIEEFPTFAANVRAAEQDWLRRSVDEAIDNADRQLEREPHQALADLQRFNDELARLEHYALVRKDLDAARQRALQACRKVALHEVEDLLDKKQFAAVAKRGAFWADALTVQAQALGEQTDLPQRLLPKRRQALTASLEAARGKVQDLIAKDDYQAIAALGVKVSEDLADEAKAVGLADEVDRFCTVCAAFGELDRQARQR